MPITLAMNMSRGRTFTLVVSLVVLIVAAISYTAYAADWLPFISRGPEQPSLQTIAPPLLASEETETRAYSWTYQHKWELTLRIPTALHTYYTLKERAPTMDYSIYVTHPVDDDLIGILADSLEQKAEQKGLLTEQTINMVAAFVQQGIQYISEEEEYPKYPLETLWDKKGDCEDKSILTAAILQAMGQEVVLFRFPDHMAVGVALGGVSSDWYYEDGTGRKYYYLETTATGWELGDIDPSYSTAVPTAYELVPAPMLKIKEYAWVIREMLVNDNTLDLKVTVDNWGTARAEDFHIHAGFQTEDGQFLGSEDSSVFSLGSEWEMVDIPLKLTMPVEEHVRLLVQVIDDGQVRDEHPSEWLDVS